MYQEKLKGDKGLVGEVFHNAPRGQGTHYNNFAKVRDDLSVMAILNGPPEFSVQSSVA